MMVAKVGELFTRYSAHSSTNYHTARAISPWRLYNRSIWSTVLERRLYNRHYVNNIGTY